MNWKQRVLNSPLYDLFGKRSYAQAGEDMIVWSELKRVVDAVLESTTLQDLVERQKKKEQPGQAMYYI